MNFSASTGLTIKDESHESTTSSTFHILQESSSLHPLIPRGPNSNSQSLRTPALSPEENTRRKLIKLPALKALHRGAAILQAIHSCRAQLPRPRFPSGCPSSFPLRRRLCLKFRTGPGLKRAPRGRQVQRGGRKSRRRLENWRTTVSQGTGAPPRCRTNRIISLTCVTMQSLRADNDGALKRERQRWIAVQQRAPVSSICPIDNGRHVAPPCESLRGN